MKTLDGTFGALLGAVALMCIPTTHAGGWENRIAPTGDAPII